MNLSEKVLSEFLHPPREFSPLPFWFWNDELSEHELLRQIDDFEAHGVYGFVIHPRVGLPHDCGWMSAKMLHFMRFAVEEAARRKMQVVLYDEGMYPSGSSSGQVVAENPDFACRGMARVALGHGEKYSAPSEHDLIYEYERDGQRYAIVNRPIDSVIRGLHYIGEREDGSFDDEEEPPAADILNPDSVACFMRLVYDRFYRELGEYFGNTVIGIFTDEPGLLGRPREDYYALRPGTRGMLQHVERILGYDFTPHLPALWHDDEENAAHWRKEYARAVQLRLEETYYKPLHDWCEQHGIALMGHPAEPDAIGQEKYFHIPGQDIVWRYVEPDKPSAIEGAQSTQAKCTVSSMIHQGRRRNSNEVYGAYGHELTFEEMKWLADWLLVRGVNMLLPHAFYYSMRGPRRDERPPDVGPNSSWWKDYKSFAEGCSRLCWLNTDSRPLCNIAVLSNADYLPWQAAKALFQNQRDFHYLEVRDLCERAVVDESGVHIAGMYYKALICDGIEIPLHAATKVLSQSGRLLHFDNAQSASNFLISLDELAPPPIRFRSSTSSVSLPDLRVRSVEKHGAHWHLLFNEGAQTLDLQVESARPPKRGDDPVTQLRDPVSGDLRDWDGSSLSLSPRQTILIVEH